MSDRPRLVDNDICQGSLLPVLEAASEDERARRSWAAPRRRTWVVPTVSFPLFHSTEQPIILAVPIIHN